MKQTLGRVFKFRRTETQRRAASFDASLRREASEALGAHERAYPAVFERAERLREKAERTSGDGMPSETARLRAVRAREEALGSLAAVRAEFVGRHGDGAGEAFDLEFETRYPAVPSQDVMEP